MILNKSAYERGFAHGSVYKTKIIDLREKGAASEQVGRGAQGSIERKHFGNRYPASAEGGKAGKPGSSAIRYRSLATIRFSLF